MIPYGHIAEAYTPYGTQVVAGQEIAKSVRFLHIGDVYKRQTIDPLLDLQIDVQSYDIDREASVYFDNSGTRDVYKRQAQVSVAGNHLSATSVCWLFHY